MCDDDPLVFWRRLQTLSSFLVVYLETFSSIFWKIFRLFLQVGGFKSEWNMSKGLDLGCAYIWDNDPYN